MGIPRRFKSLIETELKDVDIPDYAYLTYAVCAIDKESCGWAGWMIEAVFKKTGKEYPTGTGDKLLPAMMDQVCPRCGKVTWRTMASIVVVPSNDQELRAGARRDYDILEVEYDDS